MALGLFVGGTAIVGALTGIFTQMPLGMSVLWVLWAGFSSAVAMVW